MHSGYCLYHKGPILYGYVIYTLGTTGRVHYDLEFIFYILLPIIEPFLVDFRHEWWPGRRTQTLDGLVLFSNQIIEFYHVLNRHSLVKIKWFLRIFGPLNLSWHWQRLVASCCCFSSCCSCTFSCAEIVKTGHSLWSRWEMIFCFNFWLMDLEQMPHGQTKIKLPIKKKRKLRHLMEEFLRLLDFRMISNVY